VRDRTGVARRRHLPGMVRALRPRFVTDASPPRVSARRGRLPRPRRARGTRLDHISAGCTGLPLDDWLDALAEAGVEDCRGRPVMTAGRAPGGRRARGGLSGAPRRRQPGHGQTSRARVPFRSASWAPGPRWAPIQRSTSGCVFASPSWARCASRATATCADVGAALRRSDLPSPGRGFSPGPCSARSGAAHVLRVAREYLDVRLRPEDAPTPSSPRGDLGRHLGDVALHTILPGPSPRHALAAPAEAWTCSAVPCPNVAPVSPARGNIVSWELEVLGVAQETGDAS